MGIRIGRGAFNALLPLAAALSGPVQAASAVAAAPDATVGYVFNHPSERDAGRAALQSCQRRTRSECAVAFSCSGPGYGAISLRRHPPGAAQAWGGSCGQPTPQAAYRAAIDACNDKVKPARCGQPRTAWRDMQGDSASDRE